MRKITLLLILAMIATVNLKAQETDPWTEYMMPSEVHSLLKEYTGEFDMEMTMWMSEGQDPVTVKVKSTNKMILGGRFLEMTQSGNMMGMDYQAITTFGFNNSSKEMVAATSTNLGTGILFLSGGWDNSNKVASMIGYLVNPMDKKQIKIRQEVSFIDNNIILIENFDQNEGQSEKKSVEYKLTRI